MRPDIVLTHEFVEFVPDELKERTLYGSIPYKTVVHLCCCGCGREVVTPLSPTDWQLTFDGETVSLHPSIGLPDLPLLSPQVIEEQQNHAGRPVENLNRPTGPPIGESSRDIVIHAALALNSRQDENQPAFEAVRARQALPRTLRPDDVAAAVTFLASDGAAVLTGQVLCTDGGLVMR